MTLVDFVNTHGVRRVWFVSTACPTGTEFILNTDSEGEDYCSEEDLLGLRPVHDATENEVSGDADGEIRWEADLSRAKLVDSGANRITQLVVWGVRVETKHPWFVQDCAGNVWFGGKTFDTFEDGWEFVRGQVPESDWEEFFVVQDKESE